MTAWIDSHCHLETFEDPAAALARARAAGVAGAVTVGTDLSTSRRSVEIAEAVDGVWAAVGVHPHAADGFGSEVLDEIRRLATNPRVVAVGEIGLDYYRDLSPRPLQREAFRRQVEAAKAMGSPVVLHVRNAFQDVFSLLEDLGPPERLVFHCFSGGVEEAARATALGGFLSFAGNISYRSAGALRAAAAAAPPGRLLVETDSPHLAPVPHRGKPSEPAMVPVVGAALAGALGRDVEAVREATAAATREAFGLPPG